MVILSPFSLLGWTYLMALAAAVPSKAEIRGGGKNTLLERLRSPRPAVAKRDESSWGPFANRSSIANQPPDAKNNRSQDSVSSKDVNSKKFLYLIRVKNCNQAQIDDFYLTETEAENLARVETGGVPGYRYEIPRTQWLGKDWDSESSWIPWKYNYRGPIQQNFQRIRDFYDNLVYREATSITWYCGGFWYWDPCTEKGVATSTWGSTTLVRNTHNTVFCPLYFELDGLQERLKKLEEDGPIPKKGPMLVMENYLNTKADRMLAAVWKYFDTISNPWIRWDYAKGAQESWDLAKDKGTAKAYINADNYVCDAMAILMQQKYSLAMSPIPRKELAALRPDITGQLTQSQAGSQEDNVTTQFLDGNPQGWTDPSADDKDPHPSGWEQLATDESAPEDTALTCRGADRKTKWMGLDALAAAIEEFCGEAEKQGAPDSDFQSLMRIYNNGKVDAVMLSIDWLSRGLDFKPKRSECSENLGKVKDSCDPADPQHNPLKWKRGGSYRAGKVRYNIKPTAERYTPGICSMHLTETHSWGPFPKTPAYHRKHKFALKVDAKDADGAPLFDTGGRFKDAGQDGKNPLILQNKAFAEMKILPEAQGGNYIQFNIDKQSWIAIDEGKSKQKKNKSSVPRCDTKKWNATGTPRSREMDCSFEC